MYVLFDFIPSMGRCFVTKVNTAGYLSIYPHGEKVVIPVIT